VLPTDAALVAAARSGGRWAQEAIVRRHSPMVLGLLRRLVGAAHEVEDLGQDVFVQALTSLNKLREPGALSSWLGGIAVRKARSLFRRRRLLARLGLASPVALTPDLPIASGSPPDVALELSNVKRVLGSLPVDAQLALLLRRVEGHTVPEIAELMGVSLSTVKRRLGDAEAALAVLSQEGA
jgi:RNA polymerase sigma-70 factor (ECF subfamily)